MKLLSRLLSAFLILCLSFTFSFSQTVSSLLVDGRIYLKMADHAFLNVATDDNKINPADVYFLNGLINKYEIEQMIMPFPTAKSEILQRTFRLDFSNIHDVYDLIRDLENHPDIEYAEPAPLFFISNPPDDDYYNQNLSGGLFGSANSSWHLDLINAEQAWGITEGNDNIVVAVLDNAIWADHPDLVNKIVLSADLANGGDDPSPPEPTYIWSHGTHSAGIVAAETNNALGIASIGNKVSIMAVKLGDDASDGQAMAAGFEGIVWAADNGAHVINMSWGSPMFFQTMQNTVNYAYNLGCVLVGAAGNNGNGLETQMNPDIPVNYVGYPAALTHVIAVGSVDVGDNKSDFSNYGTWIDVLAPGGYATGGLMGLGAFTILSTTANTAGSAWGMLDGSTGGAGSFGVEGNYDLMQGTSMAAPVVAGLCGLMLSANPDLTPEKLTEILKNTCVNVDAQNADFIDSIGAGRVNAYEAVLGAQNAITDPVADFMASTTSIPEGGEIDFTDLSIGDVVGWSWYFEGGMPETSISQNPQGIVYNEAGIYEVSLTVSDGTTENTEIKTAFILVGQGSGISDSYWIEQNTTFSAQFRGVWAIDIPSQNTAWLLTYDGTGGSITRDFAVTSNGGNLWTPGVIQAPENLSPGDISSTDHLNAWVALYDISGGGGIYKTSDGGETWEHQQTAEFSNAASFANVLHMFNENDGYCQGDPINGEFEIYVTSDGGENWILVDGENIPDPQNDEMGWTGVGDAVGNTAWFGTNTGRVYKTTDKGQTWTVHNTGEANVSRLSFADENNGVAICAVYNQTTGQITSWKMLRTADGGESWSNINVEDQFLSDVAAVPGTPGMLIGIKISPSIAQNFSAYSLDYGTTWTMLDDSVQYTTVQMFDEYTGWAGGFNMDENNGGVYKWPGLFVGTEPYFVSMPLEEVIENEAYLYNISAVDPGDLELSISANDLPDWLTLTDNGDGTAVLSGTAPDIDTEYETFNINLIADNGDEQGSQDFVITVMTSNQAPYFTSEENEQGYVGVLYNYDITAEDPEDDDLVISATTLPAWCTLTDNGDGTALLSGTPENTSTFGYQVVLEVTDGMFTDVQSFRIFVSNPPATDPYFTSDPVTEIFSQYDYLYVAVAEDPNDLDVTISAQELPEWLTLTDNGDGTADLSGIAPEGTGTYDIELVADNGTYTGTQTFTINVILNSVEDFGFGKISVYPNPATDKIVIENTPGADYEIIDIKGRILDKGIVKSYNHELNISELTNANLFLRLRYENSFAVLKIIKINK
jgi:subtilisin family serine protease/photosystem II stability/assembly factor-like uncharacterized protein